MSLNDGKRPNDETITYRMHRLLARYHKSMVMLLMMMMLGVSFNKRGLWILRLTVCRCCGDGGVVAEGGQTHFAVSRVSQSLVMIMIIGCLFMVKHDVRPELHGDQFSAAC